jgi:DNA mismatch repair protein MutL
MVGRHPIAVINIALPPQELDVNVHPTKTAVKFTKGDLVFSAVQRAVRRALIEQAPVPRMEEKAAGYGAAVAAPELWAGEKIEAGVTTPAPGISVPAAALPVLRVLGQLFSSYIIAEGPDGLYLIDQHAAHERILFERIKYQPSEIEVQGLLEPVTIEVSPGQNEVLKSHYAGLKEFGFTIEPFGERTFLVRAVPALLNDKDWSAVLRELMDLLGGEGKGDWQESLAISMACHGAVRAGQALTDDEMRELLRQLEQVTSPRTCPHGRPTMIHLSSDQLKREFGRT